MRDVARGKVRLRSDEHGVTIQDGSEGIWLDFEELRWLVIIGGPAMLPRQPTPRELEASRPAPAPTPSERPADEGGRERGPDQARAAAPGPAPSHQVLPGLDEEEP